MAQIWGHNVQKSKQMGHIAPSAVFLHRKSACNTACTSELLNFNEETVTFNDAVSQVADPKKGPRTAIVIGQICSAKVPSLPHQLGEKGMPCVTAGADIWCSAIRVGSAGRRRLIS
jgi:hypothetical protein